MRDWGRHLSTWQLNWQLEAEEDFARIKRGVCVCACVWQGFRGNGVLDRGNITSEDCEGESVVHSGGWKQFRWLWIHVWGRAMVEAARVGRGQIMEGFGSLFSWLCFILRALGSIEALSRRMTSPFHIFISSGCLQYKQWIWAQQDCCKEPRQGTVPEEKWRVMTLP